MARKVRRSPVSRDKRFKKPAPEGAPPERWQHSDHAMEFTETAGVFAARALHEHVLDRLVLLRFIGDSGRAAGLKLHEDYHLARVEEQISASLSAVRAPSGDPQRRLERNPQQEAAYRRWRVALAAAPVYTRDILIHVACVGCWPSVAQLVKLKDGLEKLARHYGIKA